MGYRWEVIIINYYHIRSSYVIKKGSTKGPVNLTEFTWNLSSV